MNISSLSFYIVFIDVCIKHVSMQFINLNFTVKANDLTVKGIFRNK